jgi:hypothetical protein
VFTYVTVNRKKIINQITQEVSKKLNGKVTIENIDISFLRRFPKVSAVLHNVSLTDTMFAYHHHPFFKGENVFVNLGIMGLIKKESSLTGFGIENAGFYLFTDTSGYTNSYLFKRKKDPSAKSASSDRARELSSIVIKKARFTMDHQRTQKF